MKFVQPIRDLTQIEKVKLVLHKQNYRNYFLFVLGINTGLRVSDLLSLKVYDVKDKTHIRIVEQKTMNSKNKRKEKRFKINSELQHEVNIYTSDMNYTDYLFPSRKGGHIKRVMAYRILNGAAKRVGLSEIGTHTMRKTFGYHFYKKTKDVALLQNLFGHSSPSVTLRYIGINDDIMDAAIDDFSL